MNRPINVVVAFLVLCYIPVVHAFDLDIGQAIVNEVQKARDKAEQKQHQEEMRRAEQENEMRQQQEQERLRAIEESREAERKRQDEEANKKRAEEERAQQENAARKVAVDRMLAPRMKQIATQYPSLANKIIMVRPGIRDLGGTTFSSLVACLEIAVLPTDAGPRKAKISGKTVVETKVDDEKWIINLKPYYDEDLQIMSVVVKESMLSQEEATDLETKLAMMMTIQKGCSLAIEKAASKMSATYQ